MQNQSTFTAKEIDRIIEMAWEDKTPFEAIAFQFGIAEKNVIVLMRKELKRSSFNLWRKSTLQRQITLNKISKR